MTQETRRYCRVCHYDLRGSAGPTCPECGTAFDPDNRRTFLSALPSENTRTAMRVVWRLAGLVWMLIIGFFAALAIMLHTAIGRAPPSGH